MKPLLLLAYQTCAKWYFDYFQKLCQDSISVMLSQIIDDDNVLIPAHVSLSNLRRDI